MELRTEETKRPPGRPKLYRDLVRNEICVERTWLRRVTAAARRAGKSRSRFIVEAVDRAMAGV